MLPLVSMAAVFYSDLALVGMVQLKLEKKLVNSQCETSFLGH